jgi:hypothetical protein
MRRLSWTELGTIPRRRVSIGKLMEVFRASVRPVYGDDLRNASVTHTLIEKMGEIEEDLRRNLNNPQVLMEYAEQVRRKREESRRNPTMYPPLYSPS